MAYIVGIDIVGLLLYHVNIMPSHCQENEKWPLEISYQPFLFLKKKRGIKKLVYNIILIHLH